MKNLKKYFTELKEIHRGEWSNENDTITEEDLEIASELYSMIQELIENESSEE